MQFKIPQDMHIEDKLFAFISFKQFFIILGGGGISYVLYIIMSPILPPLAYAVPIGALLLLTAAVAFFKLDNLTFQKVVLLLLETILIPKKRVWKHLPEIPTNLDLLEAQLDVFGYKKSDAPKERILEEKSLEELTKLVTTEEFVKDTTKPPSF